MTPSPAGGLRVVEVSSGVAARLCGKLLADAGAEVTRVERPAGRGGALDDSGHWPAFLDRGKLVVGEAGSGLERLLAGADLFLTSLTHATGRGAGLDCPTLLERHPGLTAACVTPFGQSGPYAAHAADDLVLSALAGLADATPGFPDHCADPGDPPVQSLAPLAESAAGIVAATAVTGVILGALRGRRRIRHVEISALEVAASFMVWEWGMAAYGGGIRGRRPHTPDLSPNCCLPCKDGRVVLVAFTPPQWTALVEVMGNPEWAGDPRYATATLRSENWPSLRERLAAWALTMRGVDVLEAAQARGIPCCCAFELRDVVAGEHVREVGSVDSRDGLVLPSDPIVIDGRRRPPAAVRPATARPAAVPSTSGLDGAPLAGVRVLDCGQVVAGPFAGQLLAALGAEVLVIESRSHPLSRLFGPFVGEPAHDAAMMFHQVNQGKRSVEIDLTAEDGRRVFRELVASADVVLENFSRRAAEKLELGFETLRRAREDIILGSLSGFGRTGPWGEFVALHSGVILLSGLASVTRDADGEMRLPGALYPDLLAGAYLALAIQEALVLREHDGQGHHVEVSMLDVLFTCMGGLVPEAAAGETFGAHGGRFLATADPDGYLAVSNPDVASPEVAGLSRREAMEQLQARGIAAGAVLDIGEVMADPHLLARGFVRSGDHPIAGPRPMPAVPWLFDGERPRLGHAPLLGDGTDEALTALTALTRADVSALRSAGVLA